MQPEHALTVQQHQEFKLIWHDVEVSFNFVVIVVVMSQFMEVVGVNAEGPEPVQVHVLAELLRQARHHDPRAESRRLQAPSAPELVQALQVLRVKEHRPDGTAKVLGGVEGPQRNGGVDAKGEGRKEQEGAAVLAQGLHKLTATLRQSSVPANIQLM